MGFQGDLDSFGLAAIFQTLTANKQSGTLHVFDDTTDRYLVFTQGSIRTVSSGQRQQASLGEILVARGVITHEDLASALTRQSESSELLGNILVEMGVCSHEEIQRALRFQMEEEIYDLFTWHGARFEFDENQSNTSVIGKQPRISQVEVNTSGIVIEAMRRIDEWERIAQLIPSSNFIPVIPEERQDEALFLTLSQEEKRIASFIDGINSIDAITRQSCLGRYTVTQFIGRMIQDGTVREATPDEMRSSAESLVLQGSLQQAVMLQRRLIELDPEDLEARRQLATTYEALDQQREAGVQYNRYAEGLCALEQFEEAADAASRAVELIPDDLPTLERYANILVLTDREREAGAVWCKIIRMIETTDDKNKALKKSEEAMVDLSDYEDLLRIRARLLLETGNAKASVDIYEALAESYLAQGDRQAALTALRNILRIDSSRKDVRDEIQRLQMSDRQREKSRKALLVGTLIAFFVAGFGGYWVSYELGLRKERLTAIDNARELLDKAEAEGVSNSDIIELREQAITILANAGQSFSLLNLAETDRRQLMESLAIKNRTLRTQAEEEKKRELAVIQDWQRLRNNNSPEADAAKRAMEELVAKDPSTPNSRAAKTLLEEHRERLRQKDQEIQALLTTIADTNKDAKTRYATYDRIETTYPSLLALKAPDGVIGLTLPSKITTVSETDAILPARVMIGDIPWPKLTPCTVEMPIDTNVPIAVKRSGFGNAEGRTPFPARVEPTKTYRIVMKRVARWRVELDGSIDSAPTASPDGRFVYAGTTAGHIASFNAETGKQIWPQGGNRVVQEEAIFHLPLYANKDVIIGVGKNGVLAALNPKTGNPFWPKTGEKGPLTGEAITAYSTTQLSIGDSSDYQPGRVDILVSSRTRSSLFAVSSVDGSIRWPVGESRARALTEKTGTPAGSAFHLQDRKQILLVSEDARLHVLLDDGTYVSAFDLFDSRIEGIPLMIRTDKATVLLLVAEQAVGLHCYEIQVGPPLKLNPRWLNADFADQSLQAPFFVDGDHVYVGLESARVLRLPLADGKRDASWDFNNLPGPVTGQIVRSGNRLLIPCAGREGREGGLVAMKIGGSLDEIVWNFRVNRTHAATGATIVNRESGGLILFGAGETLYCLDDEERNQ